MFGLSTRAQFFASFSRIKSSFIIVTTPTVTTKHLTTAGGKGEYATTYTTRQKNTVRVKNIRPIPKPNKMKRHHDYLSSMNRSIISFMLFYIQSVHMLGSSRKRGPPSSDRGSRKRQETIPGKRGPVLLTSRRNVKCTSGSTVPLNHKYDHPIW